MARITLRITMKNFQDEELPHELFLRIWQKTNIKNAFANNMSMDMKLSEAQIYNIVQSGGFLGSWLGKLGKKVVTHIAISFAKNNFSGLLRNIALNLALNAMNEFERRVSRKGVVKAGKGFTLFISNEDNEDMDNVIKIVKSLEDSGILIDGVTEAVKHELKKQEGGFLGALLAPLDVSMVQPVISSVVKNVTG